MKQQEVAVMRQREASKEPPAEDDERATKTVEVKTYVEAICTPLMCIRRSVKPAGANASKQRAIGGLVQKCKRCGDCDHSHGVCTSTKPIWGKDWREYRQRRRHRRSTCPSARKGGKSVAGAKTRSSVGGYLKEVEDSKKLPKGSYSKRSGLRRLQEKATPWKRSRLGARCRTPDTRHFKEVVLCFVYCMICQ